MIFDIKMEDFHCKACLVVDRHVTDVTTMYTYTGVETYKIVCIALVLAALNLTEMMTTDILMAANILNA